MHEHASLPITNTTRVIAFAAVEIPLDWNGRRTVAISDADGETGMFTVPATLVRPLRRAALLADHNLASRVDITIDPEEMKVVAVYWED